MLGADVFDEFLARSESPSRVQLPRLGERARILDGYIDVEMGEVRPAITLDDVQHFSVGQTIREPTLIIKAHGVDNQRIVLPHPDAVTYSSYFRITRPFEYACHEGNYALKNVLSGAR